MDNYKSLLMETISKEDLVSKPAKIKRAGKLKEDLLPDEVYDTLVRKSKKTYVVGVYSTLPGPDWHYEINTEYGVYTKVPDDEGFIAHWFIQGKPQPSVEKMESMAHYLIDEYGCREVSLDEYKRIVNGKDESLKYHNLKEEKSEIDLSIFDGLKRIEFYDLDGNNPVKEFISEQNSKLQAKIIYDLKRLDGLGSAARKPLSSYIEDGILEMRTIQGNNISRIFYFFIFGDKIIMTNGYIKKTQKVDTKELMLAKNRRDKYMKKMLEGDEK